MLGYAQHSGALPSGFVGEAFDSGISHSLEGKKREGAPGAAFSSALSWCATKRQSGSLASSGDQTLISESRFGRRLGVMSYELIFLISSNNKWAAVA